MPCTKPECGDRTCTTWAWGEAVTRGCRLTAHVRGSQLRNRAEVHPVAIESPTCYRIPDDLRRRQSVRLSEAKERVHCPRFSRSLTRRSSTSGADGQRQRPSRFHLGRSYRVEGRGRGVPDAPVPRRSPLGRGSFSLMHVRHCTPRGRHLGTRRLRRHRPSAPIGPSCPGRRLGPNRSDPLAAPRWTTRPKTYATASRRYLPIPTKGVSTGQWRRLVELVGGQAR